jgi:glutathione S-transferase
MIKLWGRATSSNVQKVLWVLDELGLAYERVDVGGPFGGTGTAEYRAMQPLGLVPALEDQGVALFESNSIVRYLCNAYAPSSPLYPAAALARAQVEGWMDFQQTAMNRPMSTIFIGLVRTPADKRDTAAIATAIKDAGGMWSILDARLARQPYMAGDHLTLADIAYGAQIHRWMALDLPGRPSLPALAAWYQRLGTHAAFAKHVMITPV